MKKKRKFLRIAIFVFMALSLSLTTSQTLAYWASDVTGDVDTALAEVITGDWEQVFPYDSSYDDYVAGDLVSYNGQTYEARGNLANSFTPGSGWFWWLGWTRL